MLDRLKPRDLTWRTVSPDNEFPRLLLSTEVAQIMLRDLERVHQEHGAHC